MILVNKKESLKHILRYIDSTIMLNNMLIDFGVDDDIDAPWDVVEEVLSDLDNATHTPERNILDFLVPVG
jgi:hypothetical protein